jgi:hypothetical protein
LHSCAGARSGALPNGIRTLVAVSGDNFDPLQATQFAAFELTEKS